MYRPEPGHIEYFHEVVAPGIVYAGIRGDYTLTSNHELEGETAELT
jgi:hypothetical protein